MRQLHFHAQLTSVVGDDAAPPGHELATALTGVLEKALLLPDVDTLSAVGLVTLLVDCTQKWLTQMTTFGNTVKSFSVGTLFLPILSFLFFAGQSMRLTS